VGTDDILNEAAEHATNAGVFDEAKAQALALDHPDILILLNDGEALYAYANGITMSESVFLAQSYVTKAVLDTYPSPLESLLEEE